MSYAGSAVLTNPTPMPDDSADASDFSQFFSPDFYKRQMMWGSIVVPPGMPVTGVPGVQPQPAELAIEFDEQIVRKYVVVCGAEYVTACKTSTLTSKGKAEGRGHLAVAGLRVNIAKGTYGFNVTGGNRVRVEKKFECEEGYPGTGGTSTSSEERDFSIAGSFPE